jgi:hypothetical protein
MDEQDFIKEQIPRTITEIRSCFGLSNDERDCSVVCFQIEGVSAV